MTSNFSLLTSRRASLRPARTVLENGLVVACQPTHTTPAVAISLSVRAGTIVDPEGLPGMTWLLSRVIDRGTATRSAADIAEELDSRGITLTVIVTRHLFSLGCRCLAEDFEPVLSLLADIVISPALPEEEVAIRKGEVITAIRQDEDNPAVRANEMLMALLYPGGHPYGRPTKGSIEIVERLTRAEMLKLHATRFAPSEMTAVIVGEVDPTQAIDAASRVFGVWKKPAPPAVIVPPVLSATERRRVVIPMMNKQQADIAYGFTAIARSDPAYYAFWLMNVAFGQYAIGGRLGDSIRERQGMAYYVSSSLDANIAPGPLTIRAGVSPANVDRAVASIDEEIARLVTSGLTPQELDDTRRYLIGSIPRSLETNAAIANFIQIEEFFGLGLDYDARLPDLLNAVTLDDVHAAARRTLNPDRATVVIAGPYAGA
jgi:zinc protease